MELTNEQLDRLEPFIPSSNRKNDGRGRPRKNTIGALGARQHSTLTKALNFPAKCLPVFLKIMMYESALTPGLAPKTTF